MDLLNFEAADTPNTDSTMEVEGYDDHVEEIQNAYPEEDWRAPAEIEAETQTNLEQLSDQAFQPDSAAQQLNLTGNQVEDFLPDDYSGEMTVMPEAPERDPNRFAEAINPTTGLIDRNALRAAGVDENMIDSFNVELDLIEPERQMWELFDKNGGSRNPRNVYNTVMTIRNNPALLARYDRNGDGKFTYSDWNDITPNMLLRAFGVKDHEYVYNSEEADNRITEGWLKSLERGDWDLAAHFKGEPMARYVFQKRKGILGAQGDWLGRGGELEGEQLRASSLAGVQETIGFGLSAPEKIFAGLKAGIEDEEEEVWHDPRTWFDGDTFASTDAKLDDIIIGHTNPLSKAYAVSKPISRTWADPMMFELGRYAPVAIPALFLPGSLTAIKTGAGWKGLTTVPGVSKLGLTTAKAFGVTWLTETIPANLFADMNSHAMQTFHGTNPQVRKLFEAHPELNIAGVQMMHGVESPWSRQMELIRGEMTWDAGGLLAGNLFMRGAGDLIAAAGGKATNKTQSIIRALKEQGVIAKGNWDQLITSTRAKAPKFQSGLDFWNARNQVLGDQAEAAISQQRMALEGPNSIWSDPWSTPAQLDSPFGGYKNFKRMAGQGSSGIRSDVPNLWDQVDELRGQIGIEGGVIDEVWTPVQKAEFIKNGIPDPWFYNSADAYWNAPNIQQQLKNLNPLQRTLGNLADSTLRNIQEVMGRDAASLNPDEFWGAKLFNTKLKPGEQLDDVKRFVVKNMQVADVVNQSLLRRLRTMADAAGEQLGKGDIFATDGPMKRVADNLVLGLSNVKKTQFTWDLVRKRLAETGEELTPDMIREIEEIVGKRSADLQQETTDGIRLMMQVLDNSSSDELVEGILDVFKVSNDIHNWKDFDAWMRQKIKGGEFNGQVKTGALIHELQGVMVNSILSGPKTPLRALLGTTTNSYLNALNEAFGATIRRPFTGDIASHKASMAKLKGMFDLVPEAMTVFRKNFKAKWNADLSDIRTRYSEAPTGHDQNWSLFAEWTERNGTASDKAAFYIANVARQLNNNKLLSWSPRALAAIDDTFKWLLARARSKEIGMRQALEVAGRDHVPFSADLMKQAEDIHYKNLLDADGNLDLSQDAWLNKQFKEVTLTSELEGFSKSLDNLFNSTPLLKPFYLFARTGLNGLNFAYKNTPLLGALHKESIDILKHTGDDFTPLFKYGIENANDLANARNLFAGRQAVGAATVMTVSGMYVAGQLTGNGPADKQLRQQWLNAGWKPNHIYIGDVGFNYASLEPYNTIFSSIADIGDNMELMGSEWAEKRLQAVAFVLGRGLTSKTYMSGLDQLMQVLQMKPGALSKAGANILNNSIPLAGMRNEFGKWVNPHMNELNSDMWTSIRNRNQATEFLAGSEKLPVKHDLLNGKPINDINIIHRSFNAISPIGLDIRNNTPGRRLLLDSNYDLKSTTYSYGGYSFVKDAHVRASFQNAIGTVPITIGFKKFKNVEEALNYLATRKDVKDSIAQMQANTNNPANWDIDPNDYPHNTLIDNVMDQARSKAWAMINTPSHKDYGRLYQLKFEQDGKVTKTKQARSEILELNYPSKQIERFPK